MLEIIEEICKVAVEHGAEDVFLRGDEIPNARIGGQIHELGENCITHEQMEAFWAHCGANEDSNKERDVSWKSPDQMRYRVNCFKSMGSLCAVLRPLRADIKELAELGLPEERLTSWLTRKNGLILVTGATGCGKSTSLAACLSWVSKNLSKHIITVEDPIEYLLKSDRSMISQRQVGVDTESFACGLRSALRQSPDVILVGELRDYETARVALNACETGHLVVSTLHSANVAETAERLISMFPADERKSALMVLSKQLIGVMCQKLVATQQGGMCVLLEHIQNSGVLRKWIQEGEVGKISEFLEQGTTTENVRFIDSIMAAYRQGIITEEVAKGSCEDPAVFERMKLGVGHGSR